MAKVDFIGQRDGQLWFVPARLRFTFRRLRESHAVARIVRRASPEESAAAAEINGGRKVVRLAKIREALADVGDPRPVGPPPAPPTSSPPPTDADLLARREAGETLKAIAEDLGVSVSTVSRRLKKAAAALSGGG